MILVFDLDDTLYPEQTFVQSGFKAVAEELHGKFGWETTASQAFMLKILLTEGRGAVFNRLLESHGRMTKCLVDECVRIYRHHTPSINLFSSAEKLLQQLERPPYLVTDGHKIVQENKVRALNIEGKFKKVFITHRYGIKNAKPSLHCFERIKVMENCSWDEITYIGDNPTKDFVNLNSVGARTIRVLTGGHKDVAAKPGFEAGLVITTLDELLPKLREYT